MLSCAMACSALSKLTHMDSKSKSLSPAMSNGWLRLFVPFCGERTRWRVHLACGLGKSKIGKEKEMGYFTYTSLDSMGYYLGLEIHLAAGVSPAKNWNNI